MNSRNVTYSTVGDAPDLTLPQVLRTIARCCTVRSSCWGGTKTAESGCSYRNC